MATDHAGYQAPEKLEIIGINHVPEIVAGDDLGKIIEVPSQRAARRLKKMTSLL